MNARPRTAHRYFAVLVLTTLGAVTGALAQDRPAPAEEPAPLADYRVEVLIFEYLTTTGAEEDWSADPLRELAASAPGDGDRTSPTETTTPARLTDTARAVTEPMELRYRLVDNSELQLVDAYARMRGSRDFRPLLHTAWEQPGYPRDNAPTLDLARVGQLPARLGGTVALSLGRYLHLTLALDLGASATVAAAMSPSLESDPPIYLLRESRRLRSKELHFFDHPKFGALVRVDPVPTPDAE